MKRASEAENLIKQEQLKLKELFEENKQKIKEVDMKLNTQKKKVKDSFKCEECGKTFQTKADLKTHVKNIHPKHITCDLCELTFCESWKYEVHLKSHNKLQEHKCDECGKEFYLKWRLM